MRKIARKYDRFTKSYENSKIPFLLAEVITNGKGEMVDLVCRFSNPPAAAFLGATPEALHNQRFCSTFIPGRIEGLTPIAAVAFSGVPASFSYETLLGRQVNFSCYQVMYGLCACILDEETSALGEGPTQSGDVLTENLPAGTMTLRISRAGAQAIAFNQRLCELVQCTRKEFLNRFADNASALIVPEDWPPLLQVLLDAASSGQTVDRDLRMIRRGGTTFWVNFLAQPLSKDDSGTTFQVLALDIDQRRQEQEKMKVSTKAMTDTRKQYDRLLDVLPGGYCLFRLPEDGRTMELVQMSRGVSAMTGFSLTEVKHQLSADLFWRVHAEDRDAFVAAFSTAIKTESPLQHRYRFQKKSGAYCWLFLSAVPRRQEDGSLLFYAAYSDVTREKSAEELRFHSELCDLLLAQIGAITVDYDLAQDTAHVEIFRQDGQRQVHTIPAYLSILPVSETIHPDYRKTVLKTMESACAKPQRIAVSYLGRYGSEDYRWYRAGLVSLADGKGNVCRVIVNLEDISRQRAAEERFRHRQTRWKQGSRRALCALRLDLTADQILDAQGKNQHLLRVMFGNSAEECLSGVAGNIPDARERARFSAGFSRQELLAAFQNGRSHGEIEHSFALDGETVVRVRTELELAENPQTEHVELHGLVLQIQRE